MTNFIGRVQEVRRKKRIKNLIKNIITATAVTFSMAAATVKSYSSLQELGRGSARVGIQKLADSLKSETKVEAMQEQQLQRLTERLEARAEERGDKKLDLWFLERKLDRAFKLLILANKDLKDANDKLKTISTYKGSGMSSQTIIRLTSKAHVCALSVAGHVQEIRVILNDLHNAGGGSEIAGAIDPVVIELERTAGAIDYTAWTLARPYFQSGNPWKCMIN